VEVKVIEPFELLLCTDFYLDLNNTFVIVPSFRHNLVLVSYLDKLEICVCLFGNNEFRLSFNSNVVGISLLLVH